MDFSRPMEKYVPFTSQDSVDFESITLVCKFCGFLSTFLYVGVTSRLFIQKRLIYLGASEVLNDL